MLCPTDSLEDGKGGDEQNQGEIVAWYQGAFALSAVHW
jgi:hypothetical protein